MHLSKEKNTKELGFSGLTQFGGQISNEINTNLRGTEGVLTYRKMADTNATVGGLIHAITTLIQQAQAKPKYYPTKTI